MRRRLILRGKLDEITAPNEIFKFSLVENRSSPSLEGFGYARESIVSHFSIYFQDFQTNFHCRTILTHKIAPNSQPKFLHAILYTPNQTDDPNYSKNVV